jgi:hypothetical protein
MTKANAKSFILDISNVDLNTYEGQNYVLTECEKILLTTPDIDAVALKRITLIKDLVKMKKELDIHKELEIIKNEIEELKEERS